MRYLLLLSIILFFYSETSAQKVKSTGNNSLEVVLSTEGGHLKLSTDKMLAAYYPSPGYFEMLVPFGFFQFTFDEGYDAALHELLEKTDLREELVIRIYPQTRPIDLAGFEGDGSILSTRVHFKDDRLMNKARVWGQLDGDDFIMQFRINTDNQPLTFFGIRPNMLKRVELYSPNTILVDLLGY